MTVRFVEGRPVVTTAGVGLERGDVITALDGVPVTKLLQDWIPYYAASNEPTRLRDIARFMTRGACAEATVGVTRTTGETIVKATRVPPSARRDWSPSAICRGRTFARSRATSPI